MYEKSKFRLQLMRHRLIAKTNVDAVIYRVPNGLVGCDHTSYPRLFPLFLFFLGRGRPETARRSRETRIVLRPSHYWQKLACYSLQIAGLHFFRQVPQVFAEKLHRIVGQ